MDSNEVTLLDAALTADPAADQEMGSTDRAAIADEDLAGSRLLLVRRAVELISGDGISGGVIKLGCTFQPARGARFTWARLQLRFLTPVGIRIVDLAPREVRDSVVRMTVSQKGKFSLSYEIAEASAETGVQKEFERYHCEIIGSGETTGLARWDFTEDPDRRAGLGPSQTLAITLDVHGPVTGSVLVNARLARGGIAGVAEAVRDLILGGPADRQYAIAFDVPRSPSRPNPT